MLFRSGKFDMIRCVLFSLFAFVVLFSGRADEPFYYWVFDWNTFDEWVGYAWVPTFEDVLSNLYPGSDFVASDDSLGLAGGAVSSDADVMPLTSDEYFLSPGNYRPFSSDPVYASSTPSGPPSGGGSSDNDGGFDPSSSLGSFGSVLGGVASAVCGLAVPASVVCLSFLVYRKMVNTSSSL